MPHPSSWYEALFWIALLLVGGGVFVVILPVLITITVAIAVIMLAIFAVFADWLASLPRRCYNRFFKG